MKQIKKYELFLKKRKQIREQKKQILLEKKQKSSEYQRQYRARIKSGKHKPKKRKKSARFNYHEWILNY